MDLNQIPFVKARWFTTTAGRRIDLIVIHDMEAPEALNTAENVARYFQTISTKASAHYNIDTNSIVQSVRDKDVAYHAPGANNNGIGLEHAGYAAQTRAQWLDPYSLAELQLSAALCRALCDKHGVPTVFVDAAGLRAGRRGITTHAAVSQAFQRSDHWDPGPNFPMDVYISMVSGAVPKPAPSLPGGPPVANAPFVALLAQGDGYLQIGADGGVFNWNTDAFFGSLGGVRLNAPIVDACWTPSRRGYWMVAADGGVFSFGDAQFHGGMGGTPLNKPIVGISATEEGGYILSAEDGGVFPFGPGAQHRGNALWSG